MNVSFECKIINFPLSLIISQNFLKEAQGLGLQMHLFYRSTLITWYSIMYIHKQNAQQWNPGLLQAYRLIRMFLVHQHIAHWFRALCCYMYSSCAHPSPSVTRCTCVQSRKLIYGFACVYSKDSKSPTISKQSTLCGCRWQIFWQLGHR